MYKEDYDEHLDCALDEALKGTFPASDPVSVSVCHTTPATEKSGRMDRQSQQQRTDQGK